MKASIFAAIAAFASSVTAAVVQGTAEGFAKGVTGGGSASPVYPETTSELIDYLRDDEPRNIVLRKTFDFRGTEGRSSNSGCKPWGSGSSCQIAINKDNWCNNYQPDAPTVSSISYDEAGVLAMTIGSNKSLVGEGNKGVIIGKGVRVVGGSNIIIQNVRFTNINPQYVWGGDAITVQGGDLIWIDHCTTDLIGRQHIVLGEAASGRVSITNNEINGATSWSATCDGHHYWGMYFTGSNDLITLKNNYIHHTSGRSPKVKNNSLLHAVNNYFYANSGHAFEVDQGGQVVAEGNVFQNVEETMQRDLNGQIFASGNSNLNSQCNQYLGHNCQLNAYGSSPQLSGDNTGILANFQGKNVASAGSADDAKSVPDTAGFGRI